MCGNSIRVEAHARPLNGRVSSPGGGEGGGGVRRYRRVLLGLRLVYCCHFVDEKIHGRLEITESLLEARWMAEEFGFCSTKKKKAKAKFAAIISHLT